MGCAGLAPCCLVTLPAQPAPSCHLQSGPHPSACRRLALLIPAAQSLTADYNRAARRGAAFGLLHMTGALGALLGAVFATNVGGLRPLGLEGWRFAFGAVALASWAIGACTLALAVDPRFSRNPAYRSGQLGRCSASA